MHAMPNSTNHRLSQPSPRPATPRAAPALGRTNRRLAIAVTLIAAALAAFVLYGVFGPFDSGPENGPVIPAVVMQEETPAATPVGEHKLTIDLPASMVHSTGGISAGWDYIEFPNDRTYTYKGYCCPGPFIEYVLTGQLTVQSDAPMTIFRADGTNESIPVGQDVTLLAGDAFLAENESGIVATNHGEASAQLLGWVLVNDARFSGHGVGGFPLSLGVDTESRMAVNPGPGQVVVTRYDTLAQIPDPAPNGYQFILQAYQGQNGELKVKSSLAEMSGTPVAGNSNVGYYVLDFLMSPPGTPSPTAGTPSA